MRGKALPASQRFPPCAAGCISTQDEAKMTLNLTLNGPISSNSAVLLPALGQSVTQMPVSRINRQAAPGLAVNFSFTNQRGDSFSPLGSIWRPTYERYCFRVA
jgi:hypothetical protein